MKNYQLLIISTISFLVAISIMTGVAQKWVYFESELNEICTTTAFLSVGMICVTAIDWKTFYQWVKR